VIRTQRPLLLLLLLLAAPALRAEVVIAPAEVFSQVLLIEQETERIRTHLAITAPPRAVTPVRVELQPRHVWQKAYMVQMKLVAFRRKMGLDAIAPVGVEPRENVDPRFTWGQTQRLLTEIRILERLLGIEQIVAPETTDPVGEKRPADVFNKLGEVEALWDTLLGSGLDPSDAYAEALRLDEEVTALLGYLKVFDNAVPPRKNPEGTPADSLAAASRLLDEVQRLQRLEGLPIMDLTPFRKQENVIPDDVLNLTVLTLAELQQIKARVGMRHAIPHAAAYRTGKRPGDVAQLLGYTAAKLALIRSL